MNGKIYEKAMIEQWLKNHDTSPLTGLKINKQVYNCSTTQDMLEEFYKKFPNYYEKRYQKSTRHCNNVGKIKEIINQSKFTNLTNYTEFDWLLLGREDIIKIMESCDIISFKYLIDNMLNLEAKTTNKWRPIHYACQHRSAEMVKLLIDKNVNLEAEDTDKKRPIHFACRHRSAEMVKLLISENVNLEAETIGRLRPIHIACQHRSTEMVKLLIEKNVNLEAETVNKFRPIHYACICGSIQMIKLFVDANVDLEVEDTDGCRPFHYACRYQLAESIEFLINKGVILNSKITKYDGEKCNYGMVELIKLNDKIKLKD